MVGGVLIAIGVWAFIEKNRFYHKEVQTIYDVIFDLSIIFFVVGFIIFILGYAGCIGALRENICLLKFVSNYLHFKNLNRTICIQESSVITLVRAMMRCTFKSHTLFIIIFMTV